MNSKQREALSEIIDLIDRWRTDGVMEYWQYSQLFDVADNALAEPLRNCEVGTAEEQDERFKNFCLSYYEPCNVDGECWKCPLFKTKTRCPIAWGQMSYEKGETK